MTLETIFLVADCVERAQRAELKAGKCPSLRDAHMADAALWRRKAEALVCKSAEDRGLGA